MKMTYEEADAKAERFGYKLPRGETAKERADEERRRLRREKKAHAERQRVAMGVKRVATLERVEIAKSIKRAEVRERVAAAMVKAMADTKRQRGTTS
jgi:hypothetical protein